MKDDPKRLQYTDHPSKKGEQDAQKLKKKRRKIEKMRKYQMCTNVKDEPGRNLETHTFMRTSISKS